MKKLLFLISIFLLPSICSALTLQGVPLKGVTLKAIEEIPLPPGTLLLGDNSDYSNTGTLTDPGRSYGKQMTAVNTGIITKGYWKTTEDSDDSMILIYDADENLLAYSDTRESNDDGLNEYAFTGDNQITLTSGTSYRIAIFTQSYINYYKSTETENMDYNSGSWATPTDPWTVSGTFWNTGKMVLYVVT